MTDASLPPPPRAVKLRKGTVIGRAVNWLALLLIFVVVPLIFSTHVNRMNTLMTSGHVTQGKVINSRYISGKATSYYLTVEFNKGGRTTSVERDVPRFIYNRYPEQSEIPVVSMPSDPNDFEVGDVDSQRILDYKGGFIPGVILFGSIFTIIVIVLETTLYKERNLLAKGELVMAQVASSRYSGGRSNSTEVKYRYETSYGQRTGMGRITGKRATDYPEGKEIPVLYRKDRDTTSMPVNMFSLVQLR